MRRQQKQGSRAIAPSNSDKEREEALKKALQDVKTDCSTFKNDCSNIPDGFSPFFVELLRENHQPVRRHKRHRKPARRLKYNSEGGQRRGAIFNSLWDKRRTNSKRQTEDSEPEIKTESSDEDDEGPSEAIQAPMVEVAGPEGTVLVMRPWTEEDMRQASAHLPNIELGGAKLGAELAAFCREFRPSLNELRRLMILKYGLVQMTRLLEKWPEDARLKHTTISKTKEVVEEEAMAWSWQRWTFSHRINNVQVETLVSFVDRKDIGVIRAAGRQDHESGGLRGEGASNGSPTVSTSDEYTFSSSPSDSALCNEDKLADIFYKAHKSLPLIERWFADVEDVKTDYLYWTNHWCVLSVKLTDKQAMFYDVENAQPHISLAKPVKAEWRDAGPFMAKCHELTDWVIIDQKRLVCQRESTGWFKQPCRKTLRGLRAVTVLEEVMRFGSLTLSQLPVIPEGLEGVPSCLWAKDSYDVGLIAGCEAVRIKPKSDYRPKKMQYPLKKEAIEGITPVFNSLLERGVIVECPDSPVRTPIFPVKKIRPDGTFIPSYSEKEGPLSALIYGQDMAAHDKLTWTVEAEHAFCEMKQALLSAPTLGIPNPDKPFTQTVAEKNGYKSSVLLQEHGGKLRPVAYFSTKLDAVARGLPACLRAVAAAERAVVASREFVGYSDLTLLVPHAVSMILLEQRTSHLSAARWLRYNFVLLELSNVTVKRCNVLNPATLLPTEQDGEPHCCVSALEQICSPRPDLTDEALPNSDMILYVDGSSSRDDLGKNRAGYAVVSLTEILEQQPLPSHFSAQAAELVALTAACKLASGQRVTIYTDSRYAFGVVHDFGALWKHRKFLKADGKPILNHQLVSELLDALLLPKEVAVCKCQAHTPDNKFDRADVGARVAARHKVPR
ncbi:hypothetical protein F2P79_020134 [Pimephales promelas]|nr:hypothetical protein F2P79_020134 [Pimephales promelas]